MNLRTNMRGQLGKIITTFPVMLLIFLVIVVYLLLSGFAFAVKSQSVPSVIEGVWTDNVLLKEIKINNENTLILDGFIRDRLYEDEIKILNEKIRFGGFNNREEENAAKDRAADISRYGINLREGLIKNLGETNAGNYRGEKQCFIAFFDYGRPALNNWQFARDIYLRIEAGYIVVKSDIGELERYYDAGLLSLIKIPIKLENNIDIEFVMQSYYGRCYNPIELEELINGER